MNKEQNLPDPSLDGEGVEGFNEEDVPKTQTDKDKMGRK
jgi:hypothetical protein